MTPERQNVTVTPNRHKIIRPNTGVESWMRRCGT